jgi:hypothetical protein
MFRLTGLLAFAFGAVLLFAAYRCATDPSVTYAFIKGLGAMASAIVLLFCGAKLVTDLAAPGR